MNITFNMTFTVTQMIEVDYNQLATELEIQTFHFISSSAR